MANPEDSNFTPRGKKPGRPTSSARQPLPRTPRKKPDSCWRSLPMPEELSLWNCSGRFGIVTPPAAAVFE